MEGQCGKCLEWVNLLSWKRKLGSIDFYVSGLMNASREFSMEDLKRMPELEEGLEGLTMRMKEDVKGILASNGSCIGFYRHANKCHVHEPENW